MPMVYGLQVELLRSLEADTVEPGETLIVNLAYTTSDDTIGLIITEKLPPGFTLSSATPQPNSYDAEKGIIKWLFYSATKVGSGTITYIIEIPPDISENTYKIEGNWSATSPDNSGSGITSATDIKIQGSAQKTETVTITQTTTSTLIEQAPATEPWTFIGIGTGIAIAGIVVAILLVRKRS